MPTYRRMLSSKNDPERTLVNAILSAAIDAVICIDENGIVIEWNAAAEKTFGWSRSEAIGVELAELIIPPDLRAAHRAGRKGFVETNEARVVGRRIEVPALRKDGSHITVELTITAVHAESGLFFTAYLRDLTAQLRVDARRDAQYAIATLLAGAHSLNEIAAPLLKTLAGLGGWSFAAIWLVDGENLVPGFTWWSGPESLESLEMAIRSQRYKSGEGLPGRVERSQEPIWVADLTTDEHLPPDAEVRLAGLKSAFTFPLYASAEVVGVVELFGLSKLDPDTDLLHLATALGRNIGQFMKREQAEREMEKQTRRAEDQRRIAETANADKDRFLATVSHELRTPLTPVLLWCSAFDGAPDLPDSIRDGIRMIRANILLESRLIEDLLDLSRITHGKIRLEPAPRNLHRVLETVTQMVEAEIQRKQHRILWKLDAQNAWISGDAARLQQIFWNVLRNAIKFTPPGGMIIIHSKNEEEMLMVSIRDSGIGIDRDQLDHVFEEFHQSSMESDGGLGLGLAIAHKLVIAHGGNISATSEGRDQGSEFVVRLPCCVDAQPGADRPE